MAFWDAGSSPTLSALALRESTLTNGRLFVEVNRKQRFRDAVNDHTGVEPDAPS